jgi:DNA-binding HxlR family transcriptional regulator
MESPEFRLAALADRGDCFRRDCVARDMLGHITSRWGVLVLAALLSRKLRFAELRKRIEGISEKMLAQKLRELERDGLVHRNAYPGVPPRVEYALTPAGIEVARLLCGLIGWLEEHVAPSVVARAQYDENHSAGDIAG